MSGREVNALLAELHAANKNAEQALLNAAKCVVTLSGWTTPAGAPANVKAFVASHMAIETLRNAIEQYENPKLRLAPEPLPAGIGGNAE